MLRIYQPEISNGPSVGIGSVQVKAEIESISKLVEIHIGSTWGCVWRHSLNRLKKKDNKELIGCIRFQWNDDNAFRNKLSFSNDVLKHPFKDAEARYFCKHSKTEVPLEVPHNCAFEIKNGDHRSVFTFGERAFEVYFESHGQTNLYRFEYDSIDNFDSDMLSFDELLWRRYGAEIGFWIEREFNQVRAREFPNEKCTDCYRVAEVGNKWEEEDFENIRGCCGSFETVIEHESGRSFKIGFNYGH